MGYPGGMGTIRYTRLELEIRPFHLYFLGKWQSLLHHLNTAQRSFTHYSDIVGKL